MPTTSTMSSFQYSPEILRDFPHITGGIIIAQGVSNPPTPDALQKQYLDEQKAVRSRIGETPLSEIESINAWRRAFSAFGVSPTQYRNAAEALLRRLTKKGDIPSINTLVDIGNLVSIRYGLPVAVVDRRDVTGSITVHYSDGRENFIELGNDETLHPDVGEVIFSDEQKSVIARRWCWRQSASSAAKETTTDIIITVEAQHTDAYADVQHAVGDLLELLKAYAGGTHESAILSADHPAI